MNNNPPSNDSQSKLPQLSNIVRPLPQAAPSRPITEDPDKIPREPKTAPAVYFTSNYISPYIPYVIASEKERHHPVYLPHPIAMHYPYPLSFIPPPPPPLPSSYRPYSYQPIHRPIAQLPIFSQMLTPTHYQRPPQEPIQILTHAPTTAPPPRPEAPSVKEETKVSSSKPGSEKPTSGGAYKRRNVYKSIIRHMYSYIRKNRDDVIKVLQQANYSMSEIEHAFFEVSCYNDAEQQKGNKKQSQATIKKMIDQRSIYTYILRETLNAMIKNWDEGKHGKVSSKNLATYRDVCITYYKEAAQALEEKEHEKPSFHE